MVFDVRRTLNPLSLGAQGVGLGYSDRPTLLQFWNVRVSLSPAEWIRENGQLALVGKTEHPLIRNLERNRFGWSIGIAQYDSARRIMEIAGKKGEAAGFGLRG